MNGNQKNQMGKQLPHQKRSSTTANANYLEQNKAALKRSANTIKKKKRFQDCIPSINNETHFQATGKQIFVHALRPALCNMQNLTLMQQLNLS